MIVVVLTSTGLITADDIIDIHKLEDESGDKTVAVDSFEGNNLLLVDEGHRGASGVDWMEKRAKLCSGGFSFEYSATFTQAVNAASGAKRKELEALYARCILFDYSYKWFHGDGFGKEYAKAKYVDSRKAGQGFDGDYHREMFKADLNDQLQLDHNGVEVKAFLKGPFRYYTELYCRLWE